MPQLDESIRPTPGGYEIHCTATDLLGTLGATILWGPDRYRIGISNAHVMPERGAPVCQPNLLRGDTRKIGVVDAVAPSKLYPSKLAYFDDTEERVDSRFDFAYFFALEEETSTRIAGGIYWPETGPGIEAPPLGLRPPREGELVSWVGRTTGLVQVGMILALDYWSFEKRGESVYGLADQIVIECAIGQSKDGDSGAALVAEDKNIVGLYAGTTTDRKYHLGSLIPSSPDDMKRLLPVPEETAAIRRERWERAQGSGTAP